MINQRYDFVVLGAGTSGCYLAERLSRDNNVSVLLVDAGKDSKNPVFSMPAGFTQTLFSDKYNWRFNSVPEAQLGNRSIYCPRGKVVGGSSMINGMIHSIGQIEDYVDWQKTGFSLATPHIIMERFGKLFRVDDSITKAEPHPLESAFLSACEDAKLSIKDRLHESQSVSSGGTYHHTIHQGKRAGVLPLLPLLRKRKNVNVMTKTHIDKLHFSGSRVTRISAIQNRKKSLDIAVDGELVLCLGAIGTPSVLQRSGIGPKETLEILGIETNIDLPTGKNLQDHLLIKKTYKLSGMNTYNSDAAGPSLAKTLWDYSVNKKGPIAAGASSAGAYLSVGGEERPDTQLFFSYGSGTNSDSAFIVDPFDAVTIGTYQLRPESRGSVSISSDNPLANPKIHYNYLSCENDWKASLGGLSYQETFMESDAFSAFEPRAAIADVESDEYIRQFAETAHHPVGTCSVGENGVVNGDLMVKGLSNLRIADASIIPNLISGNTQAICAVIGDMLGEDILSRSGNV